MIFGKVYFSDHAIERYRQRVLSHKNLDESMPKKDVISMIFRDIDYKHVKEIVSFKDEYKFVFTRHNTEFIFKREKNIWLLITVIRYKRFMSYERAPKSKESIYFNIENRKKQKIEYEKGRNKDAMVRNLEQN